MPHLSANLDRRTMLGMAIAALGARPARAAAYVEASLRPAPEANQAAAADERFFYAVDNTKVAKYDRSTGALIGVSTGAAKHLNSAFVWQGKVYCAHSNYPAKPERSEIKVFDPDTLVLSDYKQFGDYRGSLTWNVRRGDRWWCNFAHYGTENAKTVLVRLTDDWKEEGAWTYPGEVVSDLGKYSISGGIWHGDDLLATGHDHRVIYRLRLPDTGTVLELKERIPCPFPGQGIASDPVTGGLVGINRAKRSVVFASLQP
jgi:hypothetical protein